MTRAPESCVSEPDHKKVKAANETVSEDTLENILVKFDFVKILNENALNKMLIIQAERKQQEHTAEGKEEPDVNRKAVVIFEKSHFNLDEVKSYLQVDNSMQLYIDNNEYKKLCIYPSKPFNSELAPDRTLLVSLLARKHTHDKMFCGRCPGAADLSGNGRPHRQVLAGRVLLSAGVL